MANAAAAKIETNDVRTAFRELMRRSIPAEAIARRIAEGLSAVETQTFSHVLGSKLKGTERIALKHVEKIAWTERRKYAEMAVQYGGLHVPKQEFAVEGQVSPADRLAELLARAARRADAARQARIVRVR